MSLAEKLIAQARNEGRQEEERPGVWKGKILLLEHMIGGAGSSAAEVDACRAAELEARFKVLEARYQARFKQG